MVRTAPATAQDGTSDILELYRARRMVAIAAVHALTPMEAHPPKPIPVETRGVAQRSEPESLLDPAPEFKIHRLRVVPKFAAGWFEERFAGVDWAYDGGNSLNPIDTTFTRELRAILEHAFGAPTRTLADHGPLHRLDQQQYVQFEYWFLVDEQWPIILMDVNGPLERGIVVSGDSRQRELLIPIRDAILGPVIEQAEKKPFADYFYEPELDEWFITGYDGESYFMRSINPRLVAPGRPMAPSRPD